ncbi:MAG: hypothetical protein RIT27_735 [Pseudomonadota bacterium]
MKNITDSCRPRGALAQMMAHSRYLLRLQTWLMQQLPPPLENQVRVANFRDKTLFLHVENGAVASRLKFLVPDLLKKLQQAKTFPQTDCIEVRVRHLDVGNGLDLEKKPPNYSEHAAEILESEANITKYEPLQAALLRLASHVKK